MTIAATAAAPRPRPLWRTGSDQATNTAAPSTSPRPASEEPSPTPPPATASTTQTANDADEVFTVGSGTGSKSPDVEPGVHRVVLTELARETGDNPFEPGQQRTVFIFTFKPANAVVDGTWRYYTGVSHKSQKLTTVLTALGVSGSSFKKSELLGREAQALIEVTEHGYTRIANLFPA